MTIKSDETRSLEEIKMEILMLKGKMKFETIKNNLDEFEMKELEEEIKEEIKILEKEENNARK